MCFRDVLAWVKILNWGSHIGKVPELCLKDLLKWQVASIGHAVLLHLQAGWKQVSQYDALSGLFVQTTIFYSKTSMPKQDIL